MFFENSSKLDVMSSVVKLITDEFLTKIHMYHRVRNSRNDLSLANYYFILVHNKTILKKINMQTVFDEMRYIVEYFIVNIFPFLIVFYWEKSKMRIIFIHHV